MAKRKIEHHIGDLWGERLDGGRARVTGIDRDGYLQVINAPFDDLVKLIDLLRGPLKFEDDSALLQEIERTKQRL